MTFKMQIYTLTRSESCTLDFFSVTLLPSMYLLTPSFGVVALVVTKPLTTTSCIIPSACVYPQLVTRVLLCFSVSDQERILFDLLLLSAAYFRKISVRFGPLNKHSCSCVHVPLDLCFNWVPAEMFVRSPHARLMLLLLQLILFAVFFCLFSGQSSASLWQVLKQGADTETDGDGTKPYQRWGTSTVL